VASHSNSKVKAYLVNGDHIDYQATIKDTENFGIGATGFCVWPEKQRMFVTYEGESIISWASTKTLSRDPDTDEFNTGVSNLAGMAVDEGNSFLYVLTRSGGRLYTYTYDENENTLSLVHPNDPCYPEREYRQLEGIEGTAYDLALDENQGLCFVSNGSKTVQYYETTDWALGGSIKMSERVAGMGIDPNNYLYGGYFNGQYGYHNYLLRYYLNGDPDDPETAIKKDMGYIIMDIAVDSDNGLIYTTTNNTEYGTSGTVEVYDVSDCTPSDANYIILTDTEYDDDFTGDKPAGIAIGPQYKPPVIGVFKIDDVNDDPNFVTCVDPNDWITYTIIIDPCGLDHEWVTVIDYLPKGVAFGGSDPNYDPNDHTYTWQLGALSATDEPVVLELTVTVTEGAEPEGKLVNAVSAESDFAYNEATEETPVCCWGGDIIYVDDTATGAETGASWADAYTDLQDALARAEKGCGNQIWAAEGTYSPGNDPCNTFEIPDGIEVYGGFAGTEPATLDPNDRDLTAYRSILTGYIDGVDTNDRVVSTGSNTILDGFYIKDGKTGVYCSGSNSGIGKCIIEDNVRYGIEVYYASIKVSWCIIESNGYHGIYSYSYGIGNKLTVNNSSIQSNAQNGIYCYYSTASIKNSVIHQNGRDGYYGIRFYYPSSKPVVRNCTIYRNELYGIWFYGSSGYKPDIRNCIIWHNNIDSGFEQLYGGLTTHYSCVTDPADPNNGTCTTDENGNIDCAPKFAYPGTIDKNLHLVTDSPCIDSGDPTKSYDNELDIDGDVRVLNGDDYSPDNGRVDMGSDEVACDDIYNPLDGNNDAIVDTKDLIVLAAAWLSDPCDDNWNPDCDIQPENGDGDVDYGDFAVFATEWLWQPCWTSSGTGIWMMMGMGGGMGRMTGGESMLISETAAEQQVSETQSEPSVAERIEQIKYLLDWLYEVRDTMDEEIWLNLVTSLEEMLKELQQD